ncbi:hypothetical protein [Candidatus Sarmatiella mevalonica]|uniref:hypothetical protein n=1 Tax=Candidatus Sarmatiella mevalonica TaxID=2770581 RepID=UPI001923566A|nr:hypothetical protein [Candidatus Sarmatiella mevalonica]
MLSKHFRWNKSRVELLGMIILSLFKTQNVQISKIDLLRKYIELEITYREGLIFFIKRV